MRRNEASGKDGLKKVKSSNEKINSKKVFHARDSKLYLYVSILKTRRTVSKQGSLTTTLVLIQLVFWQKLSLVIFVVTFTYQSHV